MLAITSVLRSRDDLAPNEDGQRISGVQERGSLESHNDLTPLSGGERVGCDEQAAAAEGTQRKESPSKRPPVDPRAPQICARAIYQELREGGFSERDVMALTGELLALVTADVRGG